MAVIQVRQLTKRFGAVAAVDRLSFEIGPGLVTGFLGPNGAGKTTTLRMLLGLVQPTSGQATIWGRRYAELGGRRPKVGVLLEASGIHPGRTVYDHLRVRCAASALPRSRVDAVLEAAGLSALAARRAGHLSLGERQRLGLAGALLGDPEVLILDDGRLICHASVSELLAGARPVVVVRTPDAARLREALQEHGAGVQVIAADRLQISGSTIEQVATVAAARRLPLFEISTQGDSLEEAFLQVTSAAGRPG